MYLDAVLKDGLRDVVFNGSPEETKEYLHGVSLDLRPHLTVVPGATLLQMTVAEYLAE